MLLGLRTAQYHVKSSDLLEARNWYANALGIKPYFDEPFYVGFNIGGFELGLVPDDVVPASRESGVAIYWGVDPIKTAFERLIRFGAKRHADIEDVGGGIKKATVLDPFGNPFGIIENPYFGK